MAGRRPGIGEAVSELLDPGSQEQYSPFGPRTVFVVDLAAEPSLEASDERLAGAESALVRLACPSVGLAVGSGAPAAAGRLAASLDLVVASEEELALVLARVAAKPLASMTLVQLLRHNAGCTVTDGLLAESLAYSTLQSGPEFTAWLAGQETRQGGAESEDEAVLVSREASRLNVELNRPGRRNAFSRAMRDAMVAALDLARRDQDIEEVVVSGRGADFCSGGDLAEFGTLDDPASAHAVRSTRNVGRMIDGMRQRVSFRLHGACVGAGIELPAFAGRVVASEDSYFELPELAMGLVPGAGGTVSIMRRIGRQRLGYMAVTGNRVPAALALAWGMIDEIDG